MCRQAIQSKDLVEAPTIEEDEDEDGATAGSADGKLLVDPTEVHDQAVHISKPMSGSHFCGRGTTLAAAGSR